MLIRIPITGSFDGTTALPAGFSVTLTSKGVYTLVDAGGGPHLNLGRITCADLLSLGLFSFETLYLPQLSHNGGAGVTNFKAAVQFPTSAGGFTNGSPVRSCDPSSVGNCGPLALVGPGDVLGVIGNAAGVQELVIEIIAVDDAHLVDTIGRSIDDSPSATPWEFPIFIPNILTAGGDVGAVVWNGPTMEVTDLRLVASNTIAGADLIVVPSINAVAMTGGTLTLGVGAAPGVDAAATPSAANVVTTGDYIAMTVAGGGNTAAGHGSVMLRGQPLG